MNDTLMYAKVPFDYNRKPLERGEILRLAGAPRDDQLIGLGYFMPYNKFEHSENPCLNCGKKFITDGFLRMHKEKKGGCLGKSDPITKAETAMLLDMDPSKIKVEE